MKIKHLVNGVDVSHNGVSLFFGIEMLLKDINLVRAQVEALVPMKKRAEVYMAFSRYIKTMTEAAQALDGE